MKSLLATGAAALLLGVVACAPGTPAEPDTAPETTADGASTAEETTSEETSSEEATSEAPAGEPVPVGIIYSRTGPLAAYGEKFLEGFEAGLDYATDGTGEVNGQKLDITYVDDTGNPEKAVSAAKDLIGQGTQIIAGSTASGVALAVAEQAAQNKVLFISGPAAADAITGINDYTFRAGRQSLQDVATAASYIEDGAKVLVFAQDNAFGQGNVAAVEMAFAAKNAEVSSVLVPEDATEFTPFARQIIDAKPDLVFVAWAGATSGAMWQALTQQGVFDATSVVTGLGDTSTYNAFGEASADIKFLNHYFAGAADNEVNAAMLDFLEADGKAGDLFTPDGFVTAQMIVHAVEEGDGSVDSMVSALEGWEFEGPKGSYQIRESDHALIQPMYQVKLVQDGANWVPELVAEIPGEEVAPPEAG
ncbi:substrate-binding domain-containing protein [Tessaracoccus sp. OS52]|uniref:substrate-binding domain-containing protein n=1 Tax=Tessaracoccus sp. OS52 TaxID=2886691 RepID=UPI001D12CB4B|nr:substrate-binding domain-containing protein [Tessaracoccus sp. OS52]MCC2594011.1 substrate-binding domain-containing protein [Tessaracoccus sp. OS52]